MASSQRGKVTIHEIASGEDYSCIGGPFGSDLTTKDYTQSGVPVIRGANLSGVGHWMSEDAFVYVSEAKADVLRRNLAFPGDIIFTQRGSLGQVARIRLDASAARYVLSQSQMKLTVDVTKADADYVCHYFRSGVGQRRDPARNDRNGRAPYQSWRAEVVPASPPAPS